MSKAIYYEKTNKESHINIFRSLEIENYFKQSLKKQGFNLHDCSFSFSDTKIKIFLSVYNKAESRQKTVEKKLLEHPSQIISRQKLKPHKENLKRRSQDNFWKNSLKGLNELTEGQCRITLKIKWVSKKFLEKNAKKSITNLQYRFRVFEMKRLYLVLTTQKKHSRTLKSLYI